MATVNKVRNIRSLLTRMDSDAGRPANFGYEDAAFEDNDIEGVASYDADRAQNVPTKDYTTYNETVLKKGIQAQGASIPREAYNHFLGRFSYNLRKLNQKTGEFIDAFLQYAAENAGLYDAGTQYPVDAICYTISVVDGVPVYTWYRRISSSPEYLQNVAPPASGHWAKMSEATMLAKPITQGQNLDTLMAEGVYFTANENVGRTLTGLPRVVAALASPVFVLTVTGNSGMIKVQTLMVGTPGEAGKEYTRVLTQSGVLQDWYLSKSPTGLEIAGVSEGVFAFRIEDIYRTNPDTGASELVDTGHLILYYNGSTPPDMELVNDSSDPLDGHLVWNYGD